MVIMADSKSTYPSTDIWPSLPLKEWADTYATLHMWTQIVGKIRKTLTPLVNHWWNTALYVTPRGLTTSAIGYGSRVFDIEFDFLDHQLVVRTSEGLVRAIQLKPRSVADFYQEVLRELNSLEIDVQIHAVPDEIAEPIPFGDDTVHASYDPEFATRFFRILAH